jgi:hypothetical protein
MMKPVKTIVIACLLLAGCAESGDDPCAMAAEYLRTCTGIDVSMPTCDEESAQEVLSSDCSALAGRATRSTSLFGSPNEKCFCDKLCHSLEDCCSGCGGDCKCDEFCHSIGDCCSWCGGEHHSEQPWEQPWEPWEQPWDGHHEEGNHEGGWCSYSGGNNWRRCNECGWQFCLPNGTWAACQRPQNPNKFPCGGGRFCSSGGHCS